jgi:hypothetical protein
MIPTTTRVEQHTDDAINKKIRLQTERNISHIAHQGGHEIDRRLKELDQEWDMERTLEANAASITLFGLALGASVNRRFFVLPAVVAGFLLQHAIQGWCPPVPIFRRLGVRTAREISAERYALKALRGDFENLPTQSDVREKGQVHRVLSVMDR